MIIRHFLTNKTLSFKEQQDTCYQVIIYQWPGKDTGETPCPPLPCPPLPALPHPLLPPNTAGPQPIQALTGHSIVRLGILFFSGRRSSVTKTSIVTKFLLEHAIAYTNTLRKSQLKSPFRSKVMKVPKLPK